MSLRGGGGHPHASLSWQPALAGARARLEAAGLRPDDAERLSRGIVVACARHAQPASSEEAARLALDEAETLALGLAAGASSALAAAPSRGGTTPAGPR
jgi:hypothetical protein